MFGTISIKQSNKLKHNEWVSSQVDAYLPTTLLDLYTWHLHLLIEYNPEEIPTTPYTIVVVVRLTIPTTPYTIVLVVG